jgi:hypothetical protein
LQGDLLKNPSQQAPRKSVLLFADTMEVARERTARSQVTLELAKEAKSEWI